MKCWYRIRLPCTIPKLILFLRAFAYGEMGRRIHCAISRSTSGVIKAVVCVNLSVGWCIQDPLLLIRELLFPPFRRTDQISFIPNHHKTLCWYSLAPASAGGFFHFSVRDRADTCANMNALQLALNRRAVHIMVAADFLSRYLNGPSPY